MNTEAQKGTPSPFTLLGQANITSGKAFLIPVADSSFYRGNVEILETDVANGTFQFDGEIAYPSAFRLQIRNDADELIYVPERFILEPGMQKIKCNIKDTRENPKLSNSTSQEYGKLKVQFNRIDIEFEDLYKRENAAKKKFKNDVPLEIESNFSRAFKTILNKKDTILWVYAKDHPNSFVTLWDLVTKVNSDYKPIYDSIYDLLSFQLKETVTGMRLKKQLHSSAILNKGNEFPRLTLLDLKNESAQISIDSSRQYTLIDFWFSHCPPCISQFGKLKELFYKYPRKFDIIAISVDNSAHVGDWRKVIAQFELPWKQFLDLNGEEATHLSINSYPTNFLLDSNGRILEANIGMEELQLRLEK